MKKSIIKMLIPVFLTGMCACSEEDLGPSIFNPDETKILNSTDQYLYDVYMGPYNVETIYRWKESETNMSYNLIPPFLSKVKPLMHIIDTTYVQPYSQIAGDNFLKINIPKQFLLIGSAGLNPDNGTEVLGTAEGGVKILIYKTNEFDRSNPATYETILHTIHHEFAHILHQKKLYDEEFKKITPNDYTSTWYNTSDSVANEKGFVSAYAMASTDEDFAEMVGIMLLNSKKSWDDKINKMGGKALLKTKEDYVIRYFETKWGINFYDLQKVVSDRINALNLFPGGQNPAYGLRSDNNTTSCACHHYYRYPKPFKVTDNEKVLPDSLHIRDYYEQVESILNKEDE